ncbi:hypothetical protein [Kitasatospora sp. NPDC088346]|uniref:hypothetical protein n=1 Tax=Kitasatospora sp. NPDC088346 TaxID=3364073 RepID=UPI00380CA24E
MTTGGTDPSQGQQRAAVALAAVLTVGAAGLLVWLSGRFGWHWGYGWLVAHGVVKAAVAIPVAAVALGTWWRQRRARGGPAKTVPQHGADEATDQAADRTTEGATGGAAAGVPH